MQRCPFRLSADSRILPFILPLLVLFFFYRSHKSSSESSVIPWFCEWLQPGVCTWTEHALPCRNSPSKLGRGRGQGRGAAGFFLPLFDVCQMLCLESAGLAGCAKDPHLCLGCVFWDLLARRAPREMHHHFHSCLNASPEAASAVV